MKKCVDRQKEEQYIKPIGKIGKQKPRENYQGGRIMFTKNAEQRNVMCMMDKEMRMYMCMSNCALMYRKLPVASADQSNAV